MIKKSIPNIDNSGTVLRELHQKFIKVRTPIDNPPGFDFVKNIVVSALSGIKKISVKLSNNRNRNFRS